MLTNVLYYISPSGENPVDLFLDSLNKKQQKKLMRVIKTITQYGLLSVIPHLRKLTGTNLWEIRIVGHDSIRVLYAVVYKDTILILHGFIKKSQKTPTKEIQTALNRLQKWRLRH